MENKKRVMSDMVVRKKSAGAGVLNGREMRNEGSEVSRHPGRNNEGLRSKPFQVIQDLEEKREEDKNTENRSRGRSWGFFGGGKSKEKELGAGSGVYIPTPEKQYNQDDFDLGDTPDEAFEDFENQDEQEYSYEEPIPVTRREFSRGPVEPKKYTGCALWVIAFLAIGAVIIGIGGFFTSATITIMPKQFTGAVDATATFSKTRGPQSVHFAVANKTFTEQKIVPSVGTTTLSSKSKGTVRMYNASATAKTIRADTVIVSTNTMKYTTDKTVTVPAKTAKGPGSIDVTVTALVAGNGSNTDLDDFTFATKNTTTAGITIRSTTPMSGGEEGNRMVADPEAVAAATTALANAFTNTTDLEKRMAEELPDTFIAIPTLFRSSKPVITTENHHADGVHVVARQTITMVAVDKQSLARFLGTTIGVAPEERLTIQKLDGLTFMTSAVIANATVPDRFQVRITGTPTLFGFIDTDQLAQSLLGTSRRAAKTLLSAQSEIASSKISLIPPWRRMLPSDSEDITIRMR